MFLAVWPPEPYRILQLVSSATSHHWSWVQIQNLGQGVTLAKIREFGPVARRQPVTSMYLEEYSLFAILGHSALLAF